MLAGVVSFLVVDDEPLVQHTLQRFLTAYGVCGVASSAAEAVAMLDRGWDGLVIDVKLGKGSGVDVLEAAREGGTRAPAVIVTGGPLDTAIVNRAARLDAWMVSKPFGAEELAGFVAKVVDRATDRAWALAELARKRWKLTEREAKILEWALRGRSMVDFRLAHGLSRNTYKSQVKTLLHKAGSVDLMSLALGLWNETAPTPW